MEAVGDGVKKFKPGDRVAVDPSWYQLLSFSNLN